jgi:hypothetical protein
MILISVFNWTTILTSYLAYEDLIFMKKTFSKDLTDPIVVNIIQKNNMDLCLFNFFDKENGA